MPVRTEYTYISMLHRMYDVWLMKLLWLCTMYVHAHVIEVQVINVFQNGLDTYETNRFYDDRWQYIYIGHMHTKANSDTD